MRIAVFTNTYRPLLNGVANVIEAYRRQLTACGHEVYVFAPAPAEPGCDAERNVFRYPSVPAPVRAEYFIALPTGAEVRRALSRTDFSIVHTHHPMWVGVWGQRFALRAGLPLVTTAHTEYRIYAPLFPLLGGSVARAVDSQVRRYCNRCALVTTPVESMREKLLNTGVQVPIELLPNPTDLSAFDRCDGSGLRAEMGAKPEDTVIGFVGRLSSEKNLPMVLEAAAMVLGRVPNCRLLLVGDGPEARDLRERVRALGILDRSHFAGRRPHEQIADCQDAIDIFVTASMSETQPLAYTEAMAVGTPVVAVRAPGAQDMIEHGHNGLLTDPAGGAQALAQAIEELARDPGKRAELGVNAHQWVRRYDVKAATQRLIGLYERAIEQSAAVRRS